MSGSWQNYEGWGFTFIGGRLEREAFPSPEFEVDQNPNWIQPSSQSSIEDNLFPISRASVGDRLLIQRLQRTSSQMCSLTKMGCNCGVEVQVMSRNPSGSVVIQIGSAQLGIGAELTDRILVSVCGYQAGDDVLNR